MKTNGGILKGLGAAAAVVALLMLGFDAAAQDTKKAPAPKAAKTASACKGLDQAACKAKAAECSWIGEVKTKAGKTRKAHCRSKPGKKK